MSHKMPYTSIAEHMASVLYPALPISARASMTEAEFEATVTKILIESGDMENEQLATEQGKLHGLYNVPGSGWIFDDDGNPSYHISFDYATFFPEEVGKQYVKELIKAYFPGFSEDRYKDALALRDLKQRRNDVRRVNKSFYKLPESVNRYLESIFVAGKKGFVYICCDYKDLSAILDVFEAYYRVYNEDGYPFIISGEQLAINQKYADLRGQANYTENFILQVGDAAKYFLIDRIEDVAKNPACLDGLENTLREALNRDIRIVFFSCKERVWLFGLSDGVKELINSADFFDTRPLCMEFHESSVRRGRKSPVTRVRLLGDLRVINDYAPTPYFLEPLRRKRAELRRAKVAFPVGAKVMYRGKSAIVVGHGTLSDRHAVAVYLSDERKAYVPYSYETGALTLIDAQKTD